MDLVFVLAMISAAQAQIAAAELVVTVMKVVFALVIVAETSMSSTVHATEVSACTYVCVAK